MRASSVDQIIVEILSREHTHLTSHQMYESIRPRLPAVNPSTIYRALERLAKAGLVSVSDMGSGAVVYEMVQGDPHHHLVCQNCGSITTVDHDLVAGFFSEVNQQTGFKVSTNHLILFGLCQDCQKTLEKELPH